MTAEPSVTAKIKGQIEGNDILLYMKGTPQMPQCGFSMRAVQILASYGHGFAFVNILENPEIRRELPKYSDWPTFPQLYVSGELVGGCDIVEQMHADDSLRELLERASADASDT